MMNTTIYLEHGSVCVNTYPFSFVLCTIYTDSFCASKCFSNDRQFHNTITFFLVFCSFFEFDTSHAQKDCDGDRLFFEISTFFKGGIPKGNLTWRFLETSPITSNIALLMVFIGIIELLWAFCPSLISIWFSTGYRPIICECTNEHQTLILTLV